MATQTKQAITGVSAGSETEIRSKYPSIAATGVGRFLGTLYDCIPTRIWGIRISHLLFPLPTAPVGVLMYALQKLTGHRYVLTNRSMQRWTVLGNRQLESVSLTDIADIEVRQLPGQEYFKAADLTLVNAKGDPIMKIGGVQSPDVFRSTILKTRDSRTETEKSLATIEARQSA